MADATLFDAQRNPIATPFRPNWSTSPKVKYAWKTGIFTARDGTEQRWSERITPRLEITFTHTCMNAAERDRAVDFLRAHQSRPVAIRDFRADADVIGGSSAAGLTVDDVTGFRAGQLVQIETRGFEFATRIASITGDVMTFSPALPASLPPHMRIVSCITASLDADIMQDEITDGVSDIDITANSLPGFDDYLIDIDGAVPGAALTGGGEEMFPLVLAHDWSAQRRVRYTRDIATSDAETGRRLERDRIGIGMRTVDTETFTLNRAQSDAAMAFLLRCRGKLTPFAYMSNPDSFPAFSAVSRVFHSYAADGLTPDEAYTWVFSFDAGDRPGILGGPWRTDNPIRIIATFPDRFVLLERFQPPRTLATEATTSNADAGPIEWIVTAEIDRKTLLPAEDAFGISIPWGTLEKVEIASAWRLEQDVVLVEMLTSDKFYCKMRLQELADYRI